MKRAFKHLDAILPGTYLLWKALYSKKRFHIIGSGSSKQGLVLQQNSVPVFCNSATSYIKYFNESDYIVTISDNMLMSDIELRELEKVRQKPIDHLRHKNKEFSNLSPKLLVFFSSNIYVRNRSELHKRIRQRNIRPQETIVFSRLEISLIEKFFILKKILSTGSKEGAKFLSHKMKTSTGVRSVLIFRILKKSISTTGIAEMTNTMTIGNYKYISNIFLSHTAIDRFIMQK